VRRWLIAAAVVLVFVTFGLLVYTYERYYRGPSEAPSIARGSSAAPLDGENGGEAA
jgi:hypothetical protein